MENVGPHNQRHAGRRSDEERRKDNIHRFCSFRCFWSKPIDPNQGEQFQEVGYEKVIAIYWSFTAIHIYIILLKFLFHMFLLLRFYVFVTVVSNLVILLSCWGSSAKLTAPLFPFCHTYFQILLHHGPCAEHNLLPPPSSFSLSLDNCSEYFPFFSFLLITI